MKGPIVNGVHLFDFPTLARHRATTCRRAGHYFTADGDYCLNCAAPWFFRLVFSTPKDGAK